MRLTRIRRASVKCVIASLLAVAILALTTPSAFAAGGVYGTLSGTVLDSTTRAPISGASVSAKSPSNSYSATTDSSGHFTVLGVSVDTYSISVTAPGHDTVNIPGVTVFGDQTNSIGAVSLEPHLATIARVTSRSVSSAYQPTQTTDQYTINQTQIVQSTGNKYSSNENAALLSVPGVTLTNNSMAYSTQVTIRGAAAWEVGYQMDGVPFREPFLNGNGSFGLMNGVGNVQVVEGAADATQAGVGAGVINIVPQRGSGPGSGELFLGVGGPNFDHQLGINYGFSTPDNRFSDYISYNGERLTPYYGYSGGTPQAYLAAFPTQSLRNDQLLNNFFFKFGKDNSQQLQVLYMNTSQQGFLTSTALDNTYYPYDFTTQNSFGYAIAAGVTGGALTPAQYSGLVGLAPGVPATNTLATSPQQLFSNQTRFLKLEYDNNLSSNTYLALRYYNWETLSDSDDTHTLGAWANGAGGVGETSSVGGPTSGVNMDLLHQFGSNLTVTLNGQYNFIRPVWNNVNPDYMVYGTGLDPGGLANAPFIGDWLPGGYVYNYFGANAVNIPQRDCSSVAVPAGYASNCLPRIPNWGINYTNAIFQNYGMGIRFQYNPTDRLRFDVGFREEGQNTHWTNSLPGQGPPASGICSGSCIAYGVAAGSTVPINNPFDVLNSSWGSNFLSPTVAEPRMSVSYEMGSNDSLRFSYGRSAVFADAQFAGTPFGMYGYEPYLNVPANGVQQCGWLATTTWNCKSYAQALYWEGDNIEAPDAGNSAPAIYNNWDFSYNHLFTNGWGLRLSPFVRTGSGLPIGTIINPVLGIFATTNEGYEKTSGVEFDLTTPQRAVGFSGFFAATYQNVLTTTEPFTSYENAFPIIPPPSVALGDLYRADFVSPFSIRIGGVENFKNGFSISPQLQMNVGYPYNLGNYVAATLANGTNMNIPQVDFGPAVSSGLGNTGSLIGSPGAAIATNYYDPANPGSALQPNIAANRGVGLGVASGSLLSHFNLNADLTLQYKWSRNTIGVQMFNLFGNAFVNTIPIVNPYYQPVATGISGPQTNYGSCANQVGAGNRGCVPVIPSAANAFTNGGYLLSNANYTSGASVGPQQPFYLQVYYSRSF